MNITRYSRHTIVARLCLSVFITSVLFLCATALVQAQDVPSLSGSNSDRTAPHAPGAVVVDGQELFVIHAPLGRYSPGSRAHNVVSRLNRLLGDPDFNPASIAAIETEKGIDIVADDLIIMTITDADVADTKQTTSELAAECVSKLQEVLTLQDAKRSVSGALDDLSLGKFVRSLVHLAFEPTILKVLIVLAGVAVVTTILALIQKSLSRHMADYSKLYAAKKIVTFVSYLVLILFATVVFRDTLGNFAIILGAATAGVAFSLKEVIASLAGWIAITFGDFYKVGDRVQLAGIKGDVVDVGFARTTLMELGEWVSGDLYSGRIVHVANSFIFSQPLFNYSSGFPFVWDEIVIPVKYGSDEKLAREILATVAKEGTADQVARATEAWRTFSKKYLVEPAQTEPMVTLILNDNWMEFTVRYVVDFKRRRLTRDQLFSSILDKFSAHKDSVAFASATFHLVDAPVIEVRLSEPNDSPNAPTK